MPTLLAPKLLNWASELDVNAREQAERCSRLPFVAGHLALMPDAHWGNGATVGSVIPTAGAIIPSAVGVDIGCGMIAVETDLTADGLPDNLDPLHGWIDQVVPAGMGRGHGQRMEPRRLNHLIVNRPPSLTANQVTKVAAQFGTLGSGNHFIEVCLDERQRVWVVLHSGSRGIGKDLATQHIEVAKGLMARYFIELEDPELAYLVEGTPEFTAYIDAMLWAQDYAAANREQMMDEVLAQLWAFIGPRTEDPRDVGGREVRRINCHHNYTEREHHHGRNVWVTRKGAIRARTGDEGIIPGSMATGTYIVRGLGNPASYDSCSHGAGRRLSRGEARRTLDADGLRSMMGDRAWNRDGRLDGKRGSLLEEDPRAYKDIVSVMADQADLVEVEHTLTQRLSFKADG